MQMITTIGLDIAKSVFQAHGLDAAGQVVIRRQLKRRFVLSFFEKLPPCLVGIEACASRMPAALEYPARGYRSPRPSPSLHHASVKLVPACVAISFPAQW
jgi:transposase